MSAAPYCAVSPAAAAASARRSRGRSRRSAPCCCWSGRDAARLAATAQAVERPGLDCRFVLADLTTAAGRDAVVHAASGLDVNLLINNAGTSEFAWFAGQSEAAVERILDVNALAPMLLTQRLLPQLQRRPERDDRQRRLDLRLPRLPGLRELQREQVCAARLHRGAAPRAGRRAGPRPVLRAARHAHGAQ